MVPLKPPPYKGTNGSPETPPLKENNLMLTKWVNIKYNISNIIKGGGFRGDLKKLDLWSNFY
jgi:hypothetical protein